MPMPGALRLSLIPMLALCQPAAAQTETVWATLGKWRVTQFEDSCMVGAEQGAGRGASALRVTMVAANDNPGMIIDNDRWMMKRNEVLEVDLSFDGGRSFMTVQGIGTDHGMSMLPRPFVIAQLRMADGMTVIHQGRILEHFALAGSDAAIASGLQCMDAVKMRLAAGKAKTPTPNP